MHGPESNTTDEDKERKKRNGEKGEENASLSRNVDSSLCLQFSFAFFHFLFDTAVRSLAAISLIINLYLTPLSTTITGKSVEIRLYSPYTCDYISFGYIYIFRSEA